MINVDNINFAYTKSTSIFNDFSLHIEQGALYGLLGPNGAGKTSLISLITGLNQPSTGQISINGQSYKQDSYAILNTLAVVPQEYAFYPQLSTYENLRFFAGLYPNQSHAANNIETAIQLTGLADYKHRLAATFSGGLKRRLNLAIGLLNRPSLLILDEPTVGIDPQSRRFILQAIQELNKQGTTVLYTSHYMHEVEQICSSLAILDNGKILRQGPLSELLSNRSAITITATDKLEGLALNAALTKFISTHRLTVDKNTITAFDLAQSSVTELITLIQDNKLSIEQIRYGRQSLEDLFFDLTHTHLREN